MGESGPLAIVILVMMFVVNWFLWLGNFVSTVGWDTIVTNDLTGIEAFGFASINLFIFIALMLGTMAYLYFRGSE